VLSILKSKAMTISELKQSGYYIQISIDHAKKQTQYQLVKDISETEKTIACELNRAAFLKAKNEIGFSTKIKPSCFLNFVPFSARNKDVIPMMEFYTNN
jgi:hypothetical protein